MEKEKRELPELKIGAHTVKYPVIQGGMGVMVSGPKLASAVAKEGGIGTIASVGLAAAEKSFSVALGHSNLLERTREILMEYVKDAKAAAKGGVIAVNCMCALSDYEDHVRAACRAGADMIISGAGLPLKLPQLTLDYPQTALVPIVSSVKAAGLILSRWLKKYGRLPDAFIVETPNAAGGHLGARDEEQALDASLSLRSVVPALLNYLKGLGHNIPVISAGGIWDGNDIADALDMGASGVQMGTRFAAAAEGDASDRFKQAYLDAGEKDVVLIKSPCGLPGRAIMSPLIKNYLSGCAGSIPCRAACLSHCVYRATRETFCIAEALVSAYRGDWDNGLFFCGSNVSRVKSIVKVKEIMQELFEGFQAPAQSMA